MQTDFEKRYHRKPLIRPSEKVEKRMKDATEELLNRLRKQPNRLTGLTYFEEIFSKDNRKQELQTLGKKVVGTFCYFIPEELIVAAGAAPIRLCSGYSETITTAEELLPRDICPLVKSSMGFPILDSGWFQFCDVLALPTSCDAKTKMGEYLADYKPVWMLNLPKVKNYTFIKKQWVTEIKTIKSKLENLTGRKIDRTHLKSAVQLYKKRSQIYRELYTLRLQHPGILSHHDLLMVIQSSFYDDVARWVSQAELLLLEMKQQTALKPWPVKGKRLMITGAPILWPNFKILNIVSELGSSVVVDDMCSGHQKLWDYAEPDEDTVDGLIESLASRYLYPSVCPCFTTSYDRIDKVLNLAKEANVEGVIYHDLRLCQLFDMEKDMLNKTLKENKIPVLTLHTDYGQEDVEQLRTRIEAFLEMIL